VFHIAPILLEIVLVAGILWSYFNFGFAAVTFLVIALYGAYTAGATQWRMKFRRAMNAQDTEANSRAIDSLLNFETVKYFGNEEHEARRYDLSMARYEKASIKTWISLAILNAGQAFFFAIGLTIAMLMSGYAVHAGQMTIGDFVMINALMIQLYMPLNFIGAVYRDIKQGLIDVEEMFALLEVDTEIRDKPGAPDLHAGRGEIVFDNVSFAYDPRQPVLTDVSFEAKPGELIAIV